MTYGTDVLAAAISVASAAVGFMFGAAANRESESYSQPEQSPKTGEQEKDDGPSDDEDSAADGDLSSIAAGFMQPCKLVSDSGTPRVRSYHLPKLLATLVAQ